jgi:CubicO group peptidase (beta-lactamase class C family)
MTDADARNPPGVVLRASGGAVGGGSAMRLKAVLTALAGAVLLLTGPASSQAPVSSLRPQPVVQVVGHTLDAQDANTWLDGFMPNALETSDVAGAVVVVVKDGKVLTQRGYGYADVATAKPVDPDKTLFRPGSVSKLFVWTAVMQLVEQGKLDLDKDVNSYSDIKMAPMAGKPITLRMLMTHTSGLEEHAKRLFVANEKRLTTLQGFLKDVPRRIYPAGEVPAYSNYGATLAGYIVERVSGEPFDSYIEKHIFGPLGMAHSSFRQPLPAALKADMASGYSIASQPAKGYELVNARPAGSVSATGPDMARFMIAHLQGGRYGDFQMLKPETVKLMQTTAFQATPPLSGMALGFYHEDRNGHVVVGHAGDTQYFHSELHLFVNDGVGLYISMNSAGKAGAAHTVREQLFHGFADRYFPDTSAPLPTASTAKKDGALIAGRYVVSRGARSNFVSLGNLLGQPTAKLNADGTVEVSAFKGPGGAAKRWREVGPLLWQEVNGASRMAAAVKNGKVTFLATDDIPPAIVLMPAPAAVNGGWAMPLLFGALGVLGLCVVLWPISTIVRWRTGGSFKLSGREAMLHRLVRAAAIVDLIVVVGWLMLFSTLGSNIAMLDDPIDPWLHLMQFLSLLGLAGAAIGLWNLVTVWTDGSRSWWGKLSSLFLALALVAGAYFILVLHLLGPTVSF